MVAGLLTGCVVLLSLTMGGAVDALVGLGGTLVLGVSAMIVDMWREDGYPTPRFIRRIKRARYLKRLEKEGNVEEDEEITEPIQSNDTSRVTISNK